MGIWGWGMGNGELAQTPNPQSPIPNPQSPLSNSEVFLYTIKINLKRIWN